MAEKEEVVIVDKNGEEHVFPAGFDPKKAAQIVSGQSGSQAETPSFGERAARAIEGSSGNRLRGFAGGAVKGAIEQAQHPFTFGGPQTEKLIKGNVPGGGAITGTLNTLASPGSAALAGGTAMAGRALAPLAGKAVQAAPKVVQQGVELAQKNPIATGAVLGGVHGGMTGGVKGAVSGAIEGAAGGGVYGKLGKIAKLAGVAEEAAGGAAAKSATKAAASKGTRLAPVSSGLAKLKDEYQQLAGKAILSPEESQRLQALETQFKDMATKMGRMHAATGTGQ